MCVCWSKTPCQARIRRSFVLFEELPLSTTTTSSVMGCTTQSKFFRFLDDSLLDGAAAVVLVVVVTVKRSWEEGETGRGDRGLWQGVSSLASCSLDCSSQRCFFLWGCFGWSMSSSVLLLLLLVERGNRSGTRSRIWVLVSPRTPRATDLSGGGGDGRFWPSSSSSSSVLLYKRRALKKESWAWMLVRMLCAVW